MNCLACGQELTEESKVIGRFATYHTGMCSNCGHISRIPGGGEMKDPRIEIAVTKLDEYIQDKLLKAGAIEIDYSVKVGVRRILLDTFNIKIQNSILDQI